MKNCTDCIYAEWKRREGGNLHPSGDGRCTYEVKVPALPASKYWGYGCKSDIPSINGGFINRKEELSDHCVYFSRKQ